MPVWYQGIVQKIEPMAPGVQQFWIEMPELERFEFKAGQFITMDLPLGEKRLQRWRSYSIASAPDGSNVLELCIVRSASGEGTKYLFENVEVGSAIKFKGPEGGFVLPETIDHDLVLVCTGTGLAPFRSMLADIRRTGRAHGNIHLIFGTREESGLLYRSELENLAKDMPGFRYDVALSRQPDWPGYKGYVHQIYLEQYREIRPDVHFYLCGWSNMIDEAVANLLTVLKYDRSQIHYELYG
jgi:ferredoxin-NADP reductase